jgi:hypothetical protein
MAAFMLILLRYNRYRNRIIGMSDIGAAWLVLFHHLPPKPDYLRVKVRRRLQRLGALPLKNSVYVLPDRADTREDFQWLAAEIRGDGGDALVCGAEFLDGITHAEIVERFRDAAAERYEEVTAAARGEREDHARLLNRLAEISRIDFFASDARANAEAAIAKLRSASRSTERTATAKPDAQERPVVAPGTVWVTRADVFVDRMATAWLIRRFIDPDARFSFVSEVRYVPRKGEVRFDMPGGEYTHEGDRCTFEVLCARFSLRDDPLDAIAEVVHDIDLKDEKYGRREVEGIQTVLRGITQSTPDDDARIELASRLFDGLYAHYGSGAA